MIINWDNEVKYELKHLLWGTTYNPYAYCQLVYKKGDALYIHMFVEEKNPKAIYTKPNEPVYKDSCLECFLMLNDSGNYLNIEVNANGVMSMGFGPKRYESIRLVPDFKPVPYKNESGWGYTLTVPEEFLLDLFKTIDNTWRGNFFKCGDDCEYEHYLSWSNIPYEEKNFHRTECFGTIKMEAR